VNQRNIISLIQTPGCNGAAGVSAWSAPPASFCRFSNHPSETTPRTLREPAGAASTPSPSLAFIQLSLWPPATSTLSSLSTTGRGGGRKGKGRREGGTASGIYILII